MWLNHKCFPPSADSRPGTAHRARATLARPRRSTLRAVPACQLSENKEPTHERLGNHLQQGRSHRASSPAVPPTSRAPKRSPSTCWNGPRPTSSRATTAPASWKATSRRNCCCAASASSSPASPKPDPSRDRQAPVASADARLLRQAYARASRVPGAAGPSDGFAPATWHLSARQGRRDRRRAYRPGPRRNARSPPRCVAVRRTACRPRRGWW